MKYAVKNTQQSNTSFLLSSQRITAAMFSSTTTSNKACDSPSSRIQSIPIFQIPCNMNVLCTIIFIGYDYMKISQTDTTFQNKCNYVDRNATASKIDGMNLRVQHLIYSASKPAEKKMKKKTKFCNSTVAMLTYEYRDILEENQQHSTQWRIQRIILEGVLENIRRQSSLISTFFSPVLRSFSHPHDGS